MAMDSIVATIFALTVFLFLIYWRADPLDERFPGGKSISA
jgi:hypothetical protein